MLTIGRLTNGWANHILWKADICFYLWKSNFKSCHQVQLPLILHAAPFPLLPGMVQQRKAVGEKTTGETQCNINAGGEKEMKELWFTVSNELFIFFFKLFHFTLTELSSVTAALYLHWSMQFSIKVSKIFPNQCSLCCRGLIKRAMPRTEKFSTPNSKWILQEIINNF